MTEKTIWVCTGGCGARISDEAHQAGKTTCGSASCKNFGKPFENRRECENCGAVMREDEEHTCDSC